MVGSWAVFVLMIIIRGRGAFLLERMGECALAIGATAAGLVMLQDIPKDATGEAVQFLFAGIFFTLGAFLLADSFANEEHWIKWKERKAAERQ